MYMHITRFLLGCASRQEPPWCDSCVPQPNQRSAFSGRYHVRWYAPSFHSTWRIDHRLTSALQLCLIEVSTAPSLRQASPPEDSTLKRIRILQHGQAIHKQVRVASSIIFQIKIQSPSVQRGYPGQDPPLTEQGIAEAAAVTLTFKPDLIISSPMTGAIQTASTAFGSILRGPAAVPLLIWPNLRESHDASATRASHGTA